MFFKKSPVLLRVRLRELIYKMYLYRQTALGRLNTGHRPSGPGFDTPWTKKSFQSLMRFHCTLPFLIPLPVSLYDWNTFDKKLNLQVFIQSIHPNSNCLLEKSQLQKFCFLYDVIYVSIVHEKCDKFEMALLIVTLYSPLEYMRHCKIN